MQVYFSHSYRDAPLNSYFIEQLVQEEIPLSADQKTDIWCVAKLERYLGEMTGLISIIPRRPTDIDAYAYSPYIGQELNLARRARLPRLLFVDNLVLDRHRLDFPADAVPFLGDELNKSDSVQHRTAIRNFRLELETTYRRVSNASSKRATVVYSQGKDFRRVAQDLAEVLKREGFGITLLSNDWSGRGLDDIRLLETLLESDLCVFMLGEKLSETHIALAMAHAHCVPSLRLFYSSTPIKCAPMVSGAIPWHSPDELLHEVGRQISSYKMGLVQPVALAREGGALSAALSVGTMVGWERKENLWNLQDGPALVDHVHVRHTFIVDEASRARKEFQRSVALDRGREASMEICRLLYNGIKRHRYGYEVEMQSGTPGFQAIRTPSQIATHGTATCIDLACLFAALLEAALQESLVVVLEGSNFSHALVGYRGREEPHWDAPSLGDLRRAISLGDAVFFEATGCVEATSPVGAETELERQEKLLSFDDAKIAATRLIFNDKVTLRHLVDVQFLRQNR
ncbi:hypothetical protein GO988_23535 [Hymenobacter sp. HMF4947]|uniref:TIR domain-containing protein n=1 Tax=Hymenobacter ginkgonis TaxID=2682976 RepID=A0A7K1TLT5_9BACT|nr:hypothetical protein [Hymenobacter ginkgonis]MVN79316.1 hypothetical protein [Hymenobacter ginkgonis]